MPKILINEITENDEIPKWVRKAWVGLELPICDNEKLRELKSSKGYDPDKPMELMGGYKLPEDVRKEGAPVYLVEFNEAMAILEKKNPKAAKWYREKGKGILSSFCPIIVISFYGDFELIPDAVSVKSWR